MQHERTMNIFGSQANHPGVPKSLKPKSYSPNVGPKEARLSPRILALRRGESAGLGFGVQGLGLKGIGFRV